MSVNTELTGSDSWVQDASVEHSSKEVSMSDKTTAVNLPEHSPSEPIDSGPKMVKQFLQVKILKLSKSVSSEPKMIKQFLQVEIFKRR